MRALVFQAAGERFALPLEHVREIQRIVAFSKVPGGPRGLLGMLDLRGRVVPALDLGEALGGSAGVHGLSTPMVIVEAGGSAAAFVVDAVDDVVTLGEAEVQEVPEFLPHRAYALGVRTTADGVLTVLDATALIGSIGSGPTDPGVAATAGSRGGAGGVR